MGEPKRDENGRFLDQGFDKTGVPNPNAGRKPLPATVFREVMENTPPERIRALWDRLLAIAEDKTAKDSDVIDALQEAFNRLGGKAKETMAHEGSVDIGLADKALDVLRKVKREGGEDAVK